MSIFQNIKKIFASKKTEEKSEKRMNLVEDVKAVLDSSEWYYKHHKPKKADSKVHHLSLGMKDGDFEWGCLIRVDEETDFVMMSGVLHENVPRESRFDVLPKIMEYNCSIVIGAVLLDMDDGEMSFKTAVDVEKISDLESVITPMLQSVIAMTPRVYKQFKEDLEEPVEESDEIEEDEHHTLH